MRIAKLLLLINRYNIVYTLYIYYSIVRCILKPQTIIHCRVTCVPVYMHARIGRDGENTILNVHIYIYIYIYTYIYIYYCLYSGLSE